MKIFGVVLFVILATFLLVGLLAFALPRFSDAVFRWDANLKRQSVSGKATKLASLGLIICSTTGFLLVLLSAVGDTSFWGVTTYNLIDTAAFALAAYFIFRENKKIVNYVVYGYAALRIALWNLDVDTLGGIFAILSVFFVFFVFLWEALYNKTKDAELANENASE